MHRQGKGISGLSGTSGTADAGGVPSRTGPAPTLVRLSSSGARVEQGQSLVLDAQVSVLGRDASSGTATGRVQFHDGDRLLGAAPLDGSGHAVLAGVQLDPGVHAVTASYTGDPGHAGGTSAPLPQTVTTALSPVSVLVSAPVQSTDGLHLDAELLDLTTGRLATGATGEMVFVSGEDTLATASLVEGRAQAVVPALPGGPLRVAYAGDAEHAPATGARTVS